VEKQVVFFPRTKQWISNPYWRMLSKLLIENGYKFDYDDNATFRLQWLIQMRKKVDVLHFHYVQQIYVYEHIHAHLWFVLRMIRNLLAARILGYQIIFTLHDLTPTYPFQPIWVDYLGHRAIFQLANNVIVHCQMAEIAAKKIYGTRKNIHVLQHPNYIGLYPNHISKQEARKELRVNLSAFVYLFLGGIRPNKGIENLITAFNQVDQDNKLLIIAGNPGNYVAYLNKLILSSNNNRILIIPRFIQENEIQVFLNAADMVVLPFQKILTSSSVMLGLSFSKPLIVPKMGCIPAQVPIESSLFYNPNNLGELIKAMEICPSLDLCEMGRIGYESISKLTWENFGKQTKTIYDTKI